MLSSMQSIPWYGYTAKNFQKMFDSLAVPIATANPNILKRWNNNEIWRPFCALTQDYLDSTPVFQDLVKTIAEDSEKLSIDERRARLQAYVDIYIPGYQVIYESEIIDYLNGSLEKRGDIERILGFRYGKDGRGAMPDRYYHALFCDRKLIVGNHHDILGHFVLLTIPEIREETEKLSQSFLDALIHLKKIQESSPQIREENRQFTESVQKVCRLSTLAWNLLQEKTYVKIEGYEGRTILNLIGAFNSVYNPIFSTRLPNKDVGQVSGALAFFNKNPMHSILMSPTELREFLGLTSNSASSECESLLAMHARLWIETVKASNISSRDLAMRVDQIVRKTLHSQFRRFKSIRKRWLAFSDEILSDEQLSLFFDRRQLLEFAKIYRLLGRALLAQKSGR